MQNIVVGIEGLVGAGKTSICRELINRLPNSVLLNGGNLYRAIVYIMMKNGSTIAKMKKSGKGLDIREMIDLFNVEVRIEDHETVIYANGEKLKEEDLQSKETSLAVSEVSNTASNEKAFQFVHDLIDDLKLKYNVIFSGRATMKIYSECDYHFFVIADLDERVRRKCIQYKNEESEQDIRENIVKRDELQRKSGFYEYSPITIEVDVTDCKTVQESTERVLENIKIKQNVYLKGG